MGESIVLLLCNGDDALFTVLTDCYCQNKGGEMYNHLETLFDSQGVKKIDAFIWTHPDKDHSVDIERMLTSYGWCMAKNHIVEKPNRQWNTYTAIIVQKGREPKKGIYIPYRQKIRR